MAPLAVLFALSISALASASSTPWPNFKQLDPDGSVFEYVALQSAEEHNSTFAWLLSAVDEKAKSKYRDIDAQWQAGQLFVPCVWSRRMVLVKLSDGGVLVYSPVELLPDVELALRRLGGVRVIVLPNSQHAVHWEAWKHAWPEAHVILPPGIQIPSWANPLIVSPGEAPEPVKEILKDFRIEVIGQTGFPEIVLQHSSRTLLTCDFVYFGSTDKEDLTGRPQVGTCTELYAAAFVAPGPKEVLLPTYRLHLQEADKTNISRSLRTLLAWHPLKIASAHAGKVSAGGADEAAAILRGTWSWCEPQPLLM